MVDQREFRETLGQFPTGVVVVTAELDSGARIGMTISSFNSVSLDPALILFSIARSAGSLELWLGCKRFAVNVLGEHQECLSNRFAQRLGAKWDGLDPIAGRTGVPLLPDTLAAFECEPYAHHEGGDHIIVVAKVLHIHRSRSEPVGPLLFHSGRYGRVEKAASLAP